MARRRGYYNTPNFTLDWSDHLNSAFKEFRKLGFVARQNFSCCGGCAGYDISTYISEKIDKNPLAKDKIKGCVFFTRQDAANLRDRGQFYLAYGPVSTKAHGQVGLDTEAVGRIIVETLKKNNIHCEWDGQGHTRIFVDVTRGGKTVFENE